MDNVVVILGKNYSTTLGVVRSLGEKNYKIDVFFISSSRAHCRILKSSKYVSELTMCERDEQGIIQRLRERYSCATEKILLITTDDYTTSVVDTYRDELKSIFLLPHLCDGAYRSIVELMDKSVQCELAERVGFHTAKSWTISVSEMTYEIPRELTYPCFFKPLVSFQGGKNGMKKCDSAAILQSELDKYKKTQQAPVIVQEYLEIDEEYSISGICFGNEVYLPALLRKRKVCESHKGTTILGVIEDIRQLGPYYEKLEQLLSGLSFYGIVDVEVFRCLDKWYFNEINFRTSAVCYGIVAGGANIPGLFAEAMYSGRLEKSKDPISFGKQFLCEKAAWDDYTLGCMTKRELHDMYRKADFYIIRNKADPKPEKAFLQFISLAGIKRFVKRRFA